MFRRILPSVLVLALAALGRPAHAADLLPPEAIGEDTVALLWLDTAKLDGKDYPAKGDPGTTSVSLRKVDANTIEETGKRNGKVIGISRMTVQPDGKTMKVEYQDELTGDSMTYMAKKQ